MRSCAGFTGRRRPSWRRPSSSSSDLEADGFTNVVLWSRGVDLDIFRPSKSHRLNTEPPIFLYVGRVAVEKNIEAFLALDLPGSKWVAGEGPALAGIRARYPRA